jgi:hypothetical protein
MILRRARSDFGLSQALAEYGALLREWSVQACRPYAREADSSHQAPSGWQYPLWGIAGADPEPLFERPAPTLGQHNDEVLAELGFAAHEIEELASAGVVTAQLRP